MCSFCSRFIIGRITSVLLFSFACCILLQAFALRAEIISPTNRTDWIPGVTVGVRGGVPSPLLRTHLIDVTASPFNADKSGRNDCAPAIQAAINSAVSNDVIYFPAGYYKCAGNIAVNKSFITLRGAVDDNGEPAANIISASGTSYLLNMGGSENPSTPSTVFGGFTKGSTNLVIDSSLTTAVGQALVPGDMLNISQDNGSDSNLNVISTGNYNNVMVQQLVVSTKSGPNVTLTTPLVSDFNRNPVIILPGFWAKTGIGLENLRLTCTNEITHEYGSAITLVMMTMLHDSWVVNCDLTDVNNYNLQMSQCVSVTVRHNRIRSAGTGSNHAGLLFASSSCLIEDNTFSGGLTPAIECNGGSGSAFMANFFTNCVVNIDYHGAHPYMNIFEQNVTAAVITDGYFGSVSHQTYLRNAIYGSFNPVTFRRWTTYMNMVGNVIGNANYTYPRYISELPSTDESIYSLGHPNIGNPNYIGNTPPIGWNYPGSTLQIYNGPQLPNGVFTFTNAPAYPTNRIALSMGTGTLTNLPAQVSSFYTLVFQDGVNTNIYWPKYNVGVSSEWNGTYVQLSQNVQFTNGWKIFVAGQFNYQQLQLGNKLTHLFHGNYDYFNNSIVWDTNVTDHNIPVSLIYQNGAPSWWGTNRWPAIDPSGFPMTLMIPAQARYLGISSGGSSSGPTKPVAPSNLRLTTP